MLEETSYPSHQLIQTAQQLMAEYFQKKIHFSKVIQLSEPNRRNLILRLIIDQPTAGMPDTIILKKTVTENGVFEKQENETEQEQLSRFAHDWAGLEFLTQLDTDHAPQFYAGSIEQKFILFEDLGVEHVSLVDSLTRIYSPSNTQEAEIALLSYVRRLGRLHADTATKSQQFTTILQRIYPQSKRLFLPEVIIPSIISKLKILPNERLLKLNLEIESVVELSSVYNNFNVLLHGDICPDNVYFQGGEVKFIDFEFGDFGNALIDGVYLRMSMPSCWCSKAIPPHIVSKMESIYRAELQGGVLLASDDAAYTKQLIYACAYWAIRTINQIDQLDLIDHEWVCPSGPVKTDSIWEPHKNTFRPRILSRLQAFVVAAENSGYLPELCYVSKYLLSYLTIAWTDTQIIDVFPVFQIRNSL